MTFAMVSDKRRTGKAIRQAKSTPVGYTQWKAPSVESVSQETEGG